MENREILKKVKNVYYDETGKFTGGNYATGLVIELEDGRMFSAQSSDVIMAFEQIKQPLECIPEETNRNHKWDDLKDAINNLDKNDLYNWISDMMVFPEEWKAKNTKEEFIKEFCNDHNGQVRWLRSVALDEDHLLTKILNWFDGYRSSQIVSEETESNSKKYKEITITNELGTKTEENDNKKIEPLQNGEREEMIKNKIDDIVDDCIEWEESWNGEEESVHKFLNKPSFKDQIFNLIKDLLSQSKKELLERIKAEATNRATDMEKHREPICREYFTEIARSRLLEEILNRELESLTNQKKYI